ncbi:MAG: lamin tail domain-containing protein, partial [Cyclobacteriaceae bacterium]|nr:lamin tail domain-containing protein [Cyclobacteriaceae bacterium]
MKSYFPFLILLQMSIFPCAFSQISDDFSDGNFTDSPAWNGETTNFMVNPDSQLQLVAPAESGKSYITTPSEIINNTEWSFYVKLTFNPSSKNYMDIYLVSDNENLNEPLNGYFVRIGNTQDEVSLYKQSGEKSTSEKIIDGVDDRVDASLVELHIKVIKSQEDKWELLVDIDLTQNYISEGMAKDNDHFYSRYFGIYCTYTSTRSNKFFFDDLTITGEIYIDNDPPEIDSLTVLSDSTLQIYFTETVSATSAIDAGNYFVNENIGNPYNAQLQNDSMVILSFQSKFEDRTEHLLTINGIEDMFSNSLDNYTTSFTYLAPYIIGFGDILITEIMADPTPGVDLPEYEYLEIFNPRNDVFKLNQVKLIVGNDTTTIPDLTISPNEYIILCQHSAVEHFEKYGRTIKVSNWPSLNNRGEPITILNQNGELVDYVNYSNSWYKTIEKDDGGWSLEMIDSGFPCKGSENWTASIDPSGGTPGR